jgi:hypothetical protein
VLEKRPKEWVLAAVREESRGNIAGCLGSYKQIKMLICKIYVLTTTSKMFVLLQIRCLNFI